ncbi:MAG: type II toxin-antitoxin system VapC family toxin [Nitrospirae bacterium]|nr:type II toxin-antitoxin system VapC family toxin [Nitrospirota bacterium]
MTQIIVPDASVLLKWAFASSEENDSDNALAFLNAWLDGKVEIVLPKLWSFEVANVLGVKKPEQAEEIMDIFIGYDFDEYDMTVELCRKALGLMRKYKVTFYDAVYHAVAILRGGILLTADERYHRKIKELPNAIRLSEWRIKG